MAPLYADTAPAARRRTIVTPESVPLHLKLATAGERAGAFLIDSAIIVGLALLVGFAGLALMVISGPLAPLVLVAVLVAMFLLRYFYFIGFEIHWQGRTPGKRMLGLRVIDRGGGALRADAVVARNLTREIETLYPVLILLNPGVLWPSAPGAVALLAGGWLLVLMLLPLLNRERLRVGDLIGGTLVVEAPRALLLADLAAPRDAGAGTEDRYRFSREQLDLYGIYELQVLEHLLRRARPDARAVEAVCEQIKKKIGWDRARWDVDPGRFLEDFYAAQRARLEHRMQLGERREHKGGVGERTKE